MKTKTILKVLVGVIVIGGGMGYFMYRAMQTSWLYYYSVDDFVAQSSIAQNHSLRIAGKVEKGSIKHDLQNMNLTFKMSGSEITVPVSYNGVVPDNFAEDIEVVVQGRLDTSGVFQADKLMTRCESKYKAKVN